MKSGASASRNLGGWGLASDCIFYSDNVTSLAKLQLLLPYSPTPSFLSPTPLELSSSAEDE